MGDSPERSQDTPVHAVSQPLDGGINKLVTTIYVAVPSTNGFLLSGLMASSLADYLVSGREDPFMHHMRPDRSIEG
jgi:hypothetical protein